MKSTGAKIAGFLALLAICVFFGIDIASSGLERVQGPPPSVRTAAAAEPSPPKETPAPPKAETVTAAPPNAVEASASVAEAAPRAGTINRLSLALGDGLRYLAKGAIRLIADAIGAVLH